MHNLGKCTNSCTGLHNSDVLVTGTVPGYKNVVNKLIFLLNMQARIELAPATKNSASPEPSVVPTTNQAGKNIEGVTCSLCFYLLPTSWLMII